MCLGFASGRLSERVQLGEKASEGAQGVSVWGFNGGVSP